VKKRIPKGSVKVSIIEEVNVAINTIKRTGWWLYLSAE
jgi:hypothetical protein